MERALVPVEQRAVEFYGDTIIAVRVKDSGVYVPVRPICELLGIDWNGQRRRINRDAVLNQELQGVDVTSTPGGRQTMLCLPLDYISGFLFGINASRVKPEVRDRLIQYQRDCYRVLAEAFTEGRLTADPAFDELQAADTPTAQANRMARAPMELDRQQLILHRNRLRRSARTGAGPYALRRLYVTLGSAMQEHVESCLIAARDKPAGPGCPGEWLFS